MLEQAEVVKPRCSDDDGGFWGVAECSAEPGSYDDASVVGPLELGCRLRARSTIDRLVRQDLGRGGRRKVRADWADLFTIGLDGRQRGSFSEAVIVDIASFGAAAPLDGLASLLLVLERTDNGIELGIVMAITSCQTRRGVVIAE